ncbi:hypothetical protein STENM327S_04804 [Streptomyces tendae]
MRPSCSRRGRHTGARTPLRSPGRRALRPDHPGQRSRPHQADHARPAVAGEHRRRPRPGREGGRGRRHRRRRRHRQAVHLRPSAGRRPQGRRAAEAARGRAGHRQGRPRHPQAPGEPRGAVVRVLQRRGHGRRRGDRPALHLPHGVGGPPRVLPPRGLPGPGPRLGRLHAAAEPDRRRQGRLGDHREQPEPEQAAQGRAGPRTRHRGRGSSAAQLAGAVADLDGVRPQGRDHRQASADRPRQGLGPGRRQGPASSPTARCTAPPRPPTAPWTSSPPPRAGTSSRVTTPRTRPSPTSSWAANCAPASTPSTWSRSAASARRVRRTSRWPAR